MRIKSDIWVGAYVRRCNGVGAFAAVVRRGDGDAGAIYVKINQLDGTAAVYGPAPMSLDQPVDSDRRFAVHVEAGAGSEPVAEHFLARQIAFDPDIWIVEVEDRKGRHFLDDWMV